MTVLWAKEPPVAVILVAGGAAQRAMAAGAT